MRQMRLGLRLLLSMTVLCLGVGAWANFARTQPAGTAVLRIERASTYVSSLIDLHAYANDEYIGSISNGETKTFAVKVGLNSLYIRDWTGQRSGVVTFRIVPDTTFRVSCRPKSVWEAVKNLPFWQTYDITVMQESKPMLVYSVNQTRGLDSDSSDDQKVKKQAQAISIAFNDQPKEIQMASEIVSVPDGVSVKITRGRTIEHTVEATWSGKAEGGINIGPEFFSAEILAAIEQKQGQTYNESERVEYEIELNGGQSTVYRLVWKDRWLTGTVKFASQARTEEIPFQFKEWTRLDIEVVK